ncbi:MAG: hypothetical protein FLDDKLPJ_01952 [Phycisphaerae bacterium]|nr:hypothetical protein [Phycisphaerae bacterium]
MTSHAAQRIAYGAIAILFLVTLTAVDAAAAQAESTWPGLAALVRHGSVIPLTFIGLTLVAAVELRRILAGAGCRPHARWAYAMIVLLMLQPWVAPTGWLGYAPQRREGIVGQLVLLGLAAAGTMWLQVRRRDPSRTLRDAGSTLLMILYLGLLPSFGLQLRCGWDADPGRGAWTLLFVVLMIKGSDIGGYLVGSVLGRHKLIPEISPSKSWEGTIGGVALSAAFALALVATARTLGAVAGGLWESEAESIAALVDEVFGVFDRLGFIRAGVLGAVLACFALLGDLFESCIKREGGVKDSASHIPTYGGILDLLDSPCGALPVAWFLLREAWGVL